MQFSKNLINLINQSVSRTETDLLDKVAGERFKGNYKKFLKSSRVLFEQGLDEGGDVRDLHHINAFGGFPVEGGEGRDEDTAEA